MGSLFCLVMTHALIKKQFSVINYCLDGFSYKHDAVDHAIK